MSEHVPAPSNVEADPRRPYKAIVGAVVTFIGLLWAALEGRQDRIGNMSTQEWIAVLVPTVLTFAAVYGVRNPKIVEQR